MIVTGLVEAVAKEISVAVKDLRLPIEYQTEDEKETVTVWRTPQIFLQYLPRADFENEAYYPCAIVEWLGTEDTLTGDGVKSVVTIGLSIGTYSYEADAWKDCFHMTQLIRTRLLAIRTVANRYRLQSDIEWSTPQDQPLPFFFTYATLPYEIFQPQEPLPLYRNGVMPDLVTTEPAKVFKANFSRRVD